jgi:hypothetical protein
MAEKEMRNFALRDKYGNWIWCLHGKAAQGKRLSAENKGSYRYRAKRSRDNLESAPIHRSPWKQAKNPRERSSIILDSNSSRFLHSLHAQLGL